jgi:hypothetical protein
MTRRLTGRPASGPASICSHTARVWSLATPVSMMVQPVPSSMMWMFTWFNAKGRARRSHKMPGASSVRVPGSGAAWV